MNSHYADAIPTKSHASTRSSLLRCAKVIRATRYKITFVGLQNPRRKVPALWTRCERTLAFPVAYVLITASLTTQSNDLPFKGITLGTGSVPLPEIGLAPYEYRGDVAPLRRGSELGAFLIDTAEAYRKGLALTDARDL
jgi:hypothetical protein